MRIKFNKGKQREFLSKVMSQIACPSLRRLGERGINVNYQTMKSYYTENRTLPLELFEDLCKLSGISVKTENLEENWGKVKGGKRRWKINGPARN